MAGTKKGGILAAETNKKRHGSQFYAEIGKLGGKKSRNGGFAVNRDLARIAGSKGGRKSRRGKAKVVPLATPTATGNANDKITA